MGLYADMHIYFRRGDDAVRLNAHAVRADALQILRGGAAGKQRRRIAKQCAARIQQ